MGDSERSSQTAPSNPKRPSTASRRGGTPGLNDEEAILSRIESMVRTAEGSGRSTPAISERGVVTPVKNSFRQTPEPVATVRAGVDGLEGSDGKSGRLTPADNGNAKALFEGGSFKQTPAPMVVDRHLFGAKGEVSGTMDSGRSSPAMTNRNMAELGQSSAEQSPSNPAVAGRPEGMLSSVKSLVRGYENGFESNAENLSQPARKVPALPDMPKGLSLDNPMFDVEESLDLDFEMSSPKPANGNGFRSEPPRTPVEKETVSWGSPNGATSSRATPLPSGRSNGTPRSNSPQLTSGRPIVTSASPQGDEEVFSRLDSIVRSIAEGSSAVSSRQHSARPTAEEEFEGGPEEELEEEVASDTDSSDVQRPNQKMTAGGMGGARPSSAVSSRRSTPQLTARSEQSVASSRPASARLPSDAATKSYPLPPANVSRPSHDATPRRESEGAWSPPAVSRPSGALGNYPPADDYADDFEGGAEEEIVEDDGPETPEDQAPPRVLNRSVQEIPRDSNPDGSGPEAPLPPRNFGPRPASAYGPRGTSAFAGNSARREVNWGDASTSESRDEGSGEGDVAGSRGPVATGSAFDNRPWSAGSAPGTGLHSGSLDGDFDRRSVDLGPVRLAKTGSFGSRGRRRGTACPKTSFECTSRTQSLR